MMLRKWVAALAALSIAGCATAAPAGPRPALWKVADADTTLYLFGTIHLLPEGLEWRTPALERAIAASDTLVLETALADDPMAAAQVMMALGVTKGLPPLAERVPAEKREALKRLVADTGVPMQALDRMETWAAGLTLAALSFQKMGFKPELGVEKGLAGSYKGAGKAIGALETVEQQFGFFDALSEEAQRKFLISILDSPELGKAEFEAMLKAWSAGDTAAIARTFDSETALSPELREVLMKRRNAAWAEWLDKRLDQPGIVMVAVGAGHLAGKDSVQTLLESRGIKATRVQ